MNAGSGRSGTNEEVELGDVADSGPAGVAHDTEATLIQPLWPLDRMLSLHRGAYGRRRRPVVTRSQNLRFLAKKLAEVVDVLARDRVADQKRGLVAQPGEVGRSDVIRMRVMMVHGKVAQLGQEVWRLAGWVERRPLCPVCVVLVDLKFARGRVRVAQGF